MLQLGARSNCKSRINTYSEKGNGANQTTPQSTEEGNWFKDETQACVPMRSLSPSSYSLNLTLSSSTAAPLIQIFTKNWGSDTAPPSLIFAMLVQQAQSQILGSDCN